MSKPSDTAVDRRVFLKQAVAGAAALTTPPAIAHAEPQAAQPTPPAGEPVQAAAGRDVDVLTQGSSGSDYMLDVFKSLGLEYVCANPGSSFRGLHESVVNYGGNSNARDDHVLPRGIVGGDGARATSRSKASRSASSRTAPSACSTRRWRSTTPIATACPCTSCSATRSTRRCGSPDSSGCTACRTRPRWCATTSSGTTRRRRLPHFGESAVRAYKIAMTPPYGPVVIVADTELQERPLPEGATCACRSSR